jgi:hypothetical protein
MELTSTIKVAFTLKRTLDVAMLKRQVNAIEANVGLIATQGSVVLS